MANRRTRYPGVKRVENGKFEIRVKVINPKTGKEKDLKRVVTAATPAEAAALREQLRTESERGGAPMEERVRLGDYATSWLRGKLPTLKASTADRYATTLDLHIIPCLGEYFIDAITPADVTRWRDSQRAAASTINARLRVLRTLLADAVQDLGLPRNPAGRVRALREKRSEDDPNVLSAKELGEVLIALREGEAHWYALFLVIGLTGMRFGEATALKWEDVDEKNKLIHVRRSQWQGIVDETKTGSRRTVPLPEMLAHALREHRRRLVAQQAPGVQDGWVFPNRAGRLLHTASLRKPLQRALTKAGIERRHTTHGFRRTFNNLVRQFTTGEVVRAMTGHVTEAMTLHYSHVDLREKHNAVDKVLATVAGEVEGWVEGGSRPN